MGLYKNVLKQTIDFGNHIQAVLSISSKQTGVATGTLCLMAIKCAKRYVSSLTPHDNAQINNQHDHGILEPQPRYQVGCSHGTGCLPVHGIVFVSRQNVICST